mgnify:FL=1
MQASFHKHKDDCREWIHDFFWRMSQRFMYTHILITCCEYVSPSSKTLIFSAKIMVDYEDDALQHKALKFPHGFNSMQRSWRDIADVPGVILVAYNAEAMEKALV